MAHIAFGNTTVYEYVHGERPLSIEEPTIRINVTIDNNGSGNANADDNAVN